MGVLVSVCVFVVCASLGVCVCASLCTNMCLVYVCVYTSIYLYVPAASVHVCIYVWMCVQVYVHVCMCMHVHMCVYVYKVATGYLAPFPFLQDYLLLEYLQFRKRQPLLKAFTVTGQ